MMLFPVGYIYAFFHQYRRGLLFIPQEWRVGYGHKHPLGAGEARYRLAPRFLLQSDQQTHAVNHKEYYLRHIDNRAISL
jgi:hypothetical protein